METIEFVGRYIKALIDKPNSGDVKKGEIGKIRGDGFVNFPSQSGYGIVFTDDKYELMPEGWSPDNSENIIPENKFIIGEIVRSIPGGEWCYSHYRIKAFPDKEYKGAITSKIFNKDEKEWWYRIDNFSNWFVEDGLYKLEEDVPESKFNIGDVINISSECLCCSLHNIKSSIHASSSNNEIILEKIYEGETWWYKCNKGKNWYTEKGMTSTSKFLKGEYIVIIKNNINGGFKTSFCYKQRTDADYLKAEKDNYGSHSNGTSAVLESYRKSWRYASSEEIIEYNRLNAPYDVTLLAKKVTYKTGDVVVCIGESKGNRDDTNLNYGGTGYKKDLCFRCTGIRGENNFRFPDVIIDGNEGGVWSSHIRLATEEEINYYKKKGGNYYITETPKENNENISKPKSDEEELLEFANKWYTIGKFFKSDICDEGKIREIKLIEGKDSIGWKIHKSNGDTYIWASNGMHYYSGICSNPYICKNGKWSELVYNNSLPTKEEILKKFPIGTKFKDLVHNREVEVGGEEITYYEDAQQIYIIVNPNSLGNRTCRIYNKGTWATKVPPISNSCKEIFLEELPMGERRSAIQEKAQIYIEHQQPLIIKTNKQKRKLITI